MRKNNNTGKWQVWDTKRANVAQVGSSVELQGIIQNSELEESTIEPTSFVRPVASPTKYSALIPPPLPFKVAAQWGGFGGYIAQAGDRPSQALGGLEVIAFGNRGTKRDDFVLVTDLGSDQYTFKDKEGERELEFASTLILEKFQTDGFFFGDDYYGLEILAVPASSQGLTTTTNGNTTTQTTPNGDYSRIRTVGNTNIVYRTGPFVEDITGEDQANSEIVDKTIINRLLTGKLDSIRSEAFTQQLDISTSNIKNWRRTIDNPFEAVPNHAYRRLTDYSAVIDIDESEVYTDERTLEVNLQGVLQFNYNFIENFEQTITIDATGSIGDIYSPYPEAYLYSIKTLSSQTINTNYHLIETNIPKIYISGEKVVLYSLRDSTLIAEVIRDDWTGEGNSLYQDAGLIGGEETQIVWLTRDFESVVTDDRNSPERFFLAHEGGNIPLESEDSFYFEDWVDTEVFNEIVAALPDLLETSGTLNFQVFASYPFVPRYRVNYPRVYRSQATLAGFSASTVIESVSDPFNSDRIYPVTAVVKVGDDIYEISGQIKFNYESWNIFGSTPSVRAYDSSSIFRRFLGSQPTSLEWRPETAELSVNTAKKIKYHAVQPLGGRIYVYNPENCLAMMRALPQGFRAKSTTLYQRKNNQIIIAFSDDSELTRGGLRYADLYKLANNKIIREGIKGGGYLPVINPSSAADPSRSTSFIGYYD